MRHFLIAIFLLSILGMLSCKKESADIQLPSLTAYYPLQMGNSYTYRLDSTIYVSFGSAAATVSYIAKDSIVSTFTDNSGRTAYLVYRYLTDTLQRHPFAYNASYTIVPTANTIEVTDANNLHFINLVQPVATGTTWLGNAYIDNNSTEFNSAYLLNWNYTYQNINQPFAVQLGSIDSTITVLQIDEVRPDNSPFDPQYFKQRDFAEEVYGKGIGLIYKDFVHWVWQPSDGINPGHYEDGSFGIRLNLINYYVQ